MCWFVFSWYTRLSTIFLSSSLSLSLTCSAWLFFFLSFYCYLCAIASHKPLRFVLQSVYNAIDAAAVAAAVIVILYVFGISCRFQPPFEQVNSTQCNGRYTSSFTVLAMSSTNQAVPTKEVEREKKRQKNISSGRSMWQTPLQKPHFYLSACILFQVVRLSMACRNAVGSFLAFLAHFKSLLFSTVLFSFIFLFESSNHFFARYLHTNAELNSIKNKSQTQSDNGWRFHELIIHVNRHFLRL